MTNGPITMTLHSVITTTDRLSAVGMRLEGIGPADRQLLTTATSFSGHKHMTVIYPELLSLIPVPFVGGCLPSSSLPYHSGPNLSIKMKQQTLKALLVTYTLNSISSVIRFTSL